jgi:hypothetical protein
MTGITAKSERRTRRDIADTAKFKLVAAICRALRMKLA